MRKFKTLIMLMIMSFVIVGIAGCNQVTRSLELSESELELALGESHTFDPVVEGVANPMFKIACDKESGLSINNLTVTADKVGVYQVKISVVGFAYLQKTVKITVTSNLNPSVTIEGETEGYVGDKLVLVSKVVDLGNDKVEWTSSDETVATVVQGIVVGLKPGKTTIRAQVGEYFDEVEVTFNGVPKVSLDKTEATVMMGDTLTLVPTIEYVEGTAVWSTSNATIATVEDGVVTPVKPGQVVITVKVGTYEAKAAVTVTPRPTLTIVEDDIVIMATKEVTLNVVLEHLEGEVEWTSSDETVAIVENGVLKALKEGKTTIKAKIGEYEDSINVTVTKVASLKFKDGERSVLYGSTLTLELILENITETVEWTSSDEKIATVANGVVTPVAKGTVTIKAKAGDFEDSVEINVELPTYSIIFQDKDGNVLKEVEIEMFGTTTAPAAPKIEGFEFVGWDKDFSKVVENIVVKAVYKAILPITYNLNDGEFIDMSQVVKSFLEGATVKLPTPSRSGYRFLGWSTVVEGTNPVMEITATEALVLYAVWEEKVVLTTVNVGPTRDYKTIASALEVIAEGGTIILDAGTYKEDVTVLLNNIKIQGPNATVNPNGGTRSDEAIIDGTITLEQGFRGLTIEGVKFIYEKALILKGENSNITFARNIIEATHTKNGGGQTSVEAQISSKGEVVDVVITESRFLVYGNPTYVAAVWFPSKATNVEVSDSYFTSDCDTSRNMFGVILPNIAGYINVKGNTFFRYPGDFWTAYFGNTAIAKNTIIDYIENIITADDYSQPISGFHFNNAKDSSIRINIIGNTLRYVKDSVLSIYGASSTDTASTPQVKIMYNKFFGESYGIRMAISAQNLTFSHNYSNKPLVKRSGSLDVATVEKDKFDTEEALDAAYAAYKAGYVSDLLDITYVTNGGVVKGSSKFVKGEVFALPTPTRVDYKFLGWTLTEEGTEYVTEIPATQETAVTVYAHWERVASVNVTYKFNGGYSEALIFGNRGDAPTLKINNYNYNEGAFWGGAYQTDIFIGDASHDPKATFSDRIYIKLNSESGLYEVVNVLASGGSSWPEGAEYVISISNSYSDYYAAIKPITQKIKKGMKLAFEKDFATSSKETPTTVAFFDELPKADTLECKVTSNDKLIVPGYLGYKFLGWYDLDNKLYTSVNDLEKDVTLYAKWQELNPVTGIDITAFPEKMLTGEKFQIVASVLPADAYFKQIMYSSSNTDIVYVSETGELVAINVGKVIITIVDYLGKVKIEKEINVEAVSSIDVDFVETYNGYVKPTETIQIDAKLVGTMPAVAKLVYTSRHPEVATVSETGLVTAVKNGYAEIVVSVEGTEYNVSVGITVNNLPTDTAIDRLIALLAMNNFAVVETGNVSLYNDGRQKVYVPTYGSVNKFLFDEYKVNTNYYSATENNPNNHKSRRTQDTIEFVTVHDTATLTGTVESIAQVMSSGETSIHYTVGNDAIFGVVPEKYIAYHAGDGTGSTFTWTKTNVKATDPKAEPVFGVNKDGGLFLTINGEKTSIKIPVDKKLSILGPVWDVVDGYYVIGGPLWDSTSYNTVGSRGGNNNSIGIEMCVNKSGDIYDTWQRTAQLVADILIRNNLGLNRVKMHNTWSGKNCPQCLIEGGYWWGFMDMVELNYEVMTTYKDAKISMVSNNPEIVDNTGRVINAPMTTTTVSYTITVELGGETRTIQLSSVVPGATTWEQWDGTYSSSRVWNDHKFGR